MPTINQLIRKPRAPVKARNTVPAQVLLGRSSFNSGKSLSAGLPVYARNQIRAIAAILEAGGQAAGKPTPNPVR